MAIEYDIYIYVIYIYPLNQFDVIKGPIDFGQYIEWIFTEA